MIELEEFSNNQFVWKCLDLKFNIVVVLFTMHNRAPLYVAMYIYHSYGQIYMCYRRWDITKTHINKCIMSTWEHTRSGWFYVHRARTNIMTSHQRWVWWCCGINICKYTYLPFGGILNVCFWTIWICCTKNKNQYVVHYRCLFEKDVCVCVCVGDDHYNIENNNFYIMEKRIF